MRKQYSKTTLEAIRSLHFLVGGECTIRNIREDSGHRTVIYVDILDKSRIQHLNKHFILNSSVLISTSFIKCPNHTCTAIGDFIDAN